MLEFKDYWWPVRWGLKARKLLRVFSGSYGGKFFKVRRPVAVFLSTLLDLDHQEIHDKTIHNHYLNERRRN